MGIIGTLLIVVFSIAAVLMILVVLIQDEQGEGFGGLFGGGGSSVPFGATGANPLVRITTVLGIIFLVSSVAVALSLKSGNSDNVIGESKILEEGSKNWFLEEEESESSSEVPSDN